MKLSSMCLGVLIVFLSGIARGDEAARPKQLVVDARIYESTESDIGRVKAGTIKLVCKPRVIVNNGQRAEFHIGEELRSDVRRGGGEAREADGVRFLDTGKFVRTRAKILDSDKIKLDVDLAGARYAGAADERKGVDAVDGKKSVILGVGEFAVFYLGVNSQGKIIWAELSASIVPSK